MASKYSVLLHAPNANGAPLPAHCAQRQRPQTSGRVTEPRSKSHAMCPMSRLLGPPPRMPLSLARPPPKRGRSLSPQCAVSGRDRSNASTSHAVVAAGASLRRSLGVRARACTQGEAWRKAWLAQDLDRHAPPRRAITQRLHAPANRHWACLLAAAAVTTVWRRFIRQLRAKATWLGSPCSISCCNRCTAPLLCITPTYSGSMHVFCTAPRA